MESGDLPNGERADIIFNFLWHEHPRFRPLKAMESNGQTDQSKCVLMSLPSIYLARNCWESVEFGDRKNELGIDLCVLLLSFDLSFWMCGLSQHFSHAGNNPMCFFSY